MTRAFKNNKKAGIAGVELGSRTVAEDVARVTQEADYMRSFGYHKGFRFYSE